jgi:hypothetical protein
MMMNKMILFKNPLIRHVPNAQLHLDAGREQNPNVTHCVRFTLATATSGCSGFPHSWLYWKAIALAAITYNMHLRDYNGSCRRRRRRRRRRRAQASGFWRSLSVGFDLTQTGRLVVVDLRPWLDLASLGNVSVQNKEGVRVCPNQTICVRVC